MTAAVDDLYEALGDCDAAALKEIAGEDFAAVLGEAERSAGGLEEYCHPYASLEYKVEDLGLDDDEAKVQVEFVYEATSYRQIIELELDDDEWKVARLGDPETQPDPETAGMSDEESLRFVTDRVLTALRDSNAPLLSRYVTGEMRSEFLPGFVALLNQSEGREADQEEMRRRWSGVMWQIGRYEMAGDGRNASVEVEMSLGNRTERWMLDLVREDGLWRCLRIGKTSD